MGILKKVLMLLLAIVVLLGIGTFLLPSDVHVERSTTVNAPASAIIAQVNNLKNWEKWSPWKKMDPDMKLTYSSDNPVGPGQWYSWDGEKSGKGKLTIMESNASEIKTKIEFEGMGESSGGWKFEPSDNGTKVTWLMDTEMSGFSKYFGLMMDGQVGPQFDEGLAGVKKLAESMPPPAPVQAIADPAEAPAEAMN